MVAKVDRYVNLCVEGAVCTTLKQLAAGKLHPLPVPVRPWLHIAVDFVTNLPSSEGNAVIGFQSCCFISLPVIPTVFQNAELSILITHFSLLRPAGGHSLGLWVSIYLVCIGKC